MVTCRFANKYKPGNLLSLLLLHFGKLALILLRRMGTRFGYFWSKENNISYMYGKITSHGFAIWHGYDRLCMAQTSSQHTTSELAPLFWLPSHLQAHSSRPTSVIVHLSTHCTTIAWKGRFFPASWPLTRHRSWKRNWMLSLSFDGRRVEGAGEGMHVWQQTYRLTG